ncbi:RNA-directed DNA polymerase (Reverse transcriptase) [Trifolium medium]|uniref:RNA-directed DNA polymerase (Reverse transcriptase) n=1 Tax=Trifolium medium TaxID=97028 RepID=A0A392NBE9_9FABA|nr:RNA-directed DNA polymerase (Reverse transcriptase) [Trifolium medium]
MRKAVQLGYFKGIKIGDPNIVVSHLQYVDDTLFIGEACVENLWCMKAILRWFELISGLKVNFYKSKLFGINLEDGFLDLAASFLKCKIGIFPFIYLGLPVGANPRRQSTWKPVIEVVKNRLSSWRNRCQQGYGEFWWLYKETFFGEGLRPNPKLVGSNGRMFVGRRIKAV